jgi:hypothetical protein
MPTDLLVGDMTTNPEDEVSGSTEGTETSQCPLYFSVFQCSCKRTQTAPRQVRGGRTFAEGVVACPQRVLLVVFLSQVHDAQAGCTFQDALNHKHKRLEMQRGVLDLDHEIAIMGVPL